MTRRTIKIEGTDVILELSKVTAVRTSKQMIHLDQLDDGTWRLIYNSNLIPDLDDGTWRLIYDSDLIPDLDVTAPSLQYATEGFKIIRED